MNLSKKNTLYLYTLTLLAFTGCGNPPARDNDGSDEVSSIENAEVNILGEEVTYTADGTTMQGYIAYDETDTTKRPGIIVVHEWWGHNEYVRQRADMLAELGYAAIAVDMYGEGKEASHPDDAKKFSAQVMQNLDVAKARFEAAYQTLAKHPAVDSTKISAIGYCFGGSLVLTMANAGYDLDGVAAFHSGVDTPIPPTADLQAAVLVQNGADDPFITPESVEGFKTQMDMINKPYTYLDYPGATHGFTNPKADEMGEEYNLPLAYNQEADMQSWERLKDFLNKLYPDTETNEVVQ